MHWYDASKNGVASGNQPVELQLGRGNDGLGAPVVVNYALVGWWHGAAATSTTGADRGVYHTNQTPNGGNVVQFDESDTEELTYDLTDAEIALWSASNEASIYIVLRAGSTADDDGILAFGPTGTDAGTSLGFLVRWGASNAIVVERETGGSNPLLLTGTTDLGTTLFHIVEVRYGGSAGNGSGELYLNGVLEAQESNLTISDHNGEYMMIGANGSDTTPAGWPGMDIAEIAVYHRKHSTQQAAEVRQYLNHKWFL